MTQPVPQNAPAPDPALVDRALIEEATKKSGLVWVGAGTGTGTPPAARPLWHLWSDGAAHLLGDGPGEQPLPEGLADGGPARVTVRSKDKGGRLVTWEATVRTVAPGTEQWDTVVAELKGKRLNAHDGEAMTERWARECRLLRLEPTGAVTEPPQGSLSAAPLPTPATTRSPVPAALPSLLLRRKRKQPC